MAQVAFVLQPRSVTLSNGVQRVESLEAMAPGHKQQAMFVPVGNAADTLLGTQDNGGFVGSVRFGFGTGDPFYAFRVSNEDRTRLEEGRDVRVPLGARSPYSATSAVPLDYAAYSEWSRTIVGRVEAVRARAPQAHHEAALQHLNNLVGLYGGLAEGDSSAFGRHATPAEDLERRMGAPAMHQRGTPATRRPPPLTVWSSPDPIFSGDEDDDYSPTPPKRQSLLKRATATVTDAASAAAGLATAAAKRVGLAGGAKKRRTRARKSRKREQKSRKRKSRKRA
jgi:hypothetical protein